MSSTGDEGIGSQTSVYGNCKRQEYLEWDDYFMAAAVLSAKRSKDPVTQVGACIVDQEKRIIAMGYNGMPNRCHDDDFPWSKNTEDSKHLYVCHAEMNAVLNKNSADVKNCKMYVSLFPCNECAKIIIQSGISQVIYMSDKNAQKKKTIAAKRMFDAAEVTYRKYKSNAKLVVIDLEEINNSTTGTPVKFLPPTPSKRRRNVDDLEGTPAKKLNLDNI